jgi:hypothetical protein
MTSDPSVRFLIEVVARGRQLWALCEREPASIADVDTWGWGTEEQKQNKICGAQFGLSIGTDDEASSPRCDAGTLP